MSRRTWIATASAVGALLWLWLFLHPRERPDFSDFHVYWIAGNNARLHLTAHAVEGHYQFKDSPFVALLWAPPTFWGNEFFWSVLRATTRAVYDGRGFWIGAAWGLALQWKLYALLLAPLWLMRRRAAVFSGAAAVTLLTLGAVALAGPRLVVRRLGEHALVRQSHGVIAAAAGLRMPRSRP